MAATFGATASKCAQLFLTVINGDTLFDLGGAPWVNGKLYQFAFKEFFFFCYRRHEIPLVASCCGNKDKLSPDLLLGSYSELTSTLVKLLFYLFFFFSFIISAI